MLAIFRRERPQPQPLATVLSPETAVAREKLKRYNQLAGQLGFETAQQQYRQQIFEDWLREKDWPIYSLTEVTRYMAKMARKEYKDWHWMPLRERDQIDTGFHENDSGSYMSTQGIYKRRVPYHALERIQTIETECNPRLREAGCLPVAFFVSDYTVRNPDPFLLAVLPKLYDRDPPRYVIDFWDEPGFGLEQMLVK